MCHPGIAQNGKEILKYRSAHIIEGIGIALGISQQRAAPHHEVKSGFESHGSFKIDPIGESPEMAGATPSDTLHTTVQVC